MPRTSTVCLADLFTPENAEKRSTFNVHIMESDIYNDEPNRETVRIFNQRFDRGVAG